MVLKLNESLLFAEIALLIVEMQRESKLIICLADHHIILIRFGVARLCAESYVAVECGNTIIRAYQLDIFGGTYHHLHISVLLLC